MATVIDTLVVQLALDPSKFTAGQRQAVAQAKQTLQELLGHAKAIEHAQREGLEQFRHLTRAALEFTAVLLGGRSLLQFAEQTTKANAALIRFTRAFGQNFDTLTGWRGAVRMVGGDADDVNRAFGNMSDTLQEFRLTGRGAGMETIALLGQIGSVAGVSIDPLRVMRGDIDQLAFALAKLAEKDRPMAAFLGRRLGVSPSMMEVILRGPQAMARLRAEAARWAPSREGAETLEHLDEAFQGLLVTSEGLGTSLLIKLAPALESLIKDFKEFLIGIDWNSVRKELEAFGKGALDAVKKIGTIFDSIRLYREGRETFSQLFTDIFDVRPEDVIKPGSFLARLAKFLSAPFSLESMREFLGVTAPSAGAEKSWKDWFLGEGVIGNWLRQGMQGGAGAGEEPVPAVRGRAGPRRDLGVLTGVTAPLRDQIRELVPELREFTAFQDRFHRRGAHAAGRAIDFTITGGPEKAAEVAARLRRTLPDVKVIDEYNFPSPGATGPHIHIERRVGAEGAGGTRPATTRGGGEGFGGAAVPFLENMGAAPGATFNQQRTTSINSHVHIAQLTVTTQAKDADEVAAALGPALERQKKAFAFNVGTAAG